MSTPSMEILITVLKDILNDQDVHITTNLNLVNDLNIDSIQLINFILKVEEKLGIDIDYQGIQLEHLESIKQFHDYIMGIYKS
ncbi:D-alanyl carrier protein [Paenibacillus elgii]|uniref:D-alanyl carrier protein n=1 Tax=Paenibacillus elgii TaxID=189691 RepID=A0A2T6FRX7_9BACL|nr:acyl carrier protein [Paenibacillus elgii]PUA34626.1 D-alanyl carrier protein [Paenibacillus elgii]